MKNKKFILFTILISISFNLFAQVSLDCNDSFYKDAKNWETKGIIGWLPQMRPYSIKTIKGILDKVKQNGDEKDIALAEYYEEKYFSKGWNLSLEISEQPKFSNDTEGFKNLFSVEPALWGDMELFKIVGFGYKIGVMAQNGGTDEKEILPLFYNKTKHYTHNDPFRFGSAIANIDMAANLTVGNENLYGMVGLNRIAYGPFIGDSVLLSGTQSHSPNFSFITENEKWSYAQVLSVISRANKNAESDKDNLKPNKFFAFHSLRLTPTEWFAFSYFEGAIITNRFDPSYLIPVPYMMLQCMYNATDNLISGITFDFRPMKKLGISLSGVIDDIDLDQMAKGNFNARFKFALQTGVNYTPDVDFIDNISLDYTIVSPFTYSHCDSRFYDDANAPLWEKTGFLEDYNKDSFTNNVTSLGTRLPPNSDRIDLKASFTPVERLRVDLSTTFVRHANIAESYTDDEALQYLIANSIAKQKYSEEGYYYSTDGSVWTTGGLSKPSRNQMNFMNQDHKMYLFQLGINAQYDLPRQKWGQVSFMFGYMFEYIHNKGVDSNIYSGINFSGYDPTDENQSIIEAKNQITAADVKNAKENWVANFRNVFNNYFSISVKYCY